MVYESGGGCGQAVSQGEAQEIQTSNLRPVGRRPPKRSNCLKVGTGARFYHKWAKIVILGDGLPCLRVGFGFRGVGRCVKVVSVLDKGYFDGKFYGGASDEGDTSVGKGQVVSRGVIEDRDIGPDIRGD